MEYKNIKNLRGYKDYYSDVFQVEKDNKYYTIKQINIKYNDFKTTIKDLIKDIPKEVEILSKLTCKNIVKYYDSFLDKDKFYILMEYCDRQNLRDFINEHIKNNELIEEDILYNIIKQLCIGIKEIHNKNIIHRDLVPEHIFINENNEIKLGGFDISRYQIAKFLDDEYFGGTCFQYMPPEILKELEFLFNEKSNMWSLGCIIYELFNLSKYYDDRADNKIKKLDFNIYNNKWQEIINSLLQKDYNKRMNINEVCDILNEMNHIFIKDIEYKIIKELGKGAFGRVVEVKKNNKYYAIKEIKLETELKDKIKEIQKEAEILSKFNCKNIVKYYDSFLDKDKFYILMEYCDRQNLRDFINEHIKNNELIEEDILYNIIKQLCIGIKEIHEKNIIHRDLKPENIFMNENNVLKIGDFGISKQIDPNKENPTTHFKAGSNWYMPPEIEIKGIYNKKSDMYSLGYYI